MPRKLDETTLELAARHYARQFMMDSIPSPSHPGRWIGGRDWVIQDFHNFMFKDEFEWMVPAFLDCLGKKFQKEFEDIAKEKFTPRSDATFHELLRSKLAIDVEGAHIPGVRGTTQLGMRSMGEHRIEVEPVWSIRRRKMLGLDKSHRDVESKVVRRHWPIYAGEAEERDAIRKGDRDYDTAGMDPIDMLGIGGGATNTRISNEVALLMCDACVDNLDEGTSNAVVTGRDGAQPADPDTAASGTLLFTLACTDPAFGNASDAAPGGQATAAAVSDDTSADATATVGYCRASATNDGSTPLDDHIDGEAGTSGADFNFNTTAIVSGATVSLTSWTVTQPES